MSRISSKHSFPLYKMILLSVFYTLLIPTNIRAQHNGNPLFFQGFADQNSTSVKGLAYGNAYTSRSGDINSLFYNPAGLAGIQSTQISVASDYNRLLERDNQNFYPGGDYLNTSLYLESLIIPDPSWNGIWDDVLGNVDYDSLGNPVTDYWNIDQIYFPIQGKDVYSRDAADHEEKFEDFGLDHLTIASPINITGKQLVLACSFYRHNVIHDYDWNGAHLNPHWGTSDIITAGLGDTTRTDWSVYTRKRDGAIYSIAGAIGIKISETIQIGAKINHLTGKTNDQQSLDRTGYFLTRHQYSRWAFSYDTCLSVTNGTSKFNASTFNFGTILTTDHFNLGISIKFPGTVHRKWNYSTNLTAPYQATSYDSSGTDYVRLPGTYSLGMTIMPGNRLTLSFDAEKTPYRKAKYTPDESFQDSLTIYNKFPDQTAIRFGVEYRHSDKIAIIAGYQFITAPFIPYGAAFRLYGPPIEHYSIGLSLDILHGQLDIAYTMQQLKYYDAYMTNRNFTLEQSQKFQIGYTFIF